MRHGVCEEAGSLPGAPFDLSGFNTRELHIHAAAVRATFAAFDVARPKRRELVYQRVDPPELGLCTFSAKACRKIGLPVAGIPLERDCINASRRAAARRALASSP
jgi:hypothetical protein